MNRSQKIAAFTLNEMIVVLILASIVVGLAFTSLRLIQKQMLGIQPNYTHSLNLNTLEVSLWIDFNRYSNITFNALDKELKFANAIDSTLYTLTPEFIVSAKDTFNIKTTTIQFYFNGTLSDGKAQIDAIEIDTAKEFGDKTLFIFKKNSASTFMN